VRLEYSFDIGQIGVPRFSVEAVEGIGKVFTLATLVMNVLEVKPRVELVFHGLNPEDPGRKIEAFRHIIDGATSTPELRFELGQGGAVPGSSSYYQWVTVHRAGA